MQKELAVLSALAALAAAPVHAQYPERPIRILIPFTPGGGTDILARMLGQKFSEAWGQQVVADNRPGGNGVIAAELTAKANPDGHTLLMVAIGHAINPSLRKSLPYDTLKDFTPISLTAMLPLMVAVHPSVKANSLQELIALAKSPDKPITYASGGIGSSQHLAAELINYMAKVKMTHVPYKGGNQGLLDVVAGQVDMMASTILTVAPHARAGRLRALAITTAKRSQAWPDLPTVAEAGIPGYQSIAWYGLVAPANVPPSVLQKISTEAMKAAKAPDVQDALTKQGAEPVGSTPAEFSAFIKSEMTKYAQVVKQAGVSAE
jgi:tripartite-type tricarboxylate transporter receptor subunit TctC